MYNIYTGVDRKKHPNLTQLINRPISVWCNRHSYWNKTEYQSDSTQVQSVGSRYLNALMSKLIILGIHVLCHDLGHLLRVYIIPHNPPPPSNPSPSVNALHKRICCRGSGPLTCRERSERWSNNSVVTLAIFYGVALWGSSSTADRKRLDRRIKQANSVLGCLHDPVEVMRVTGGWWLSHHLQNERYRRTFLWLLSDSHTNTTLSCPNTLRTFHSLSTHCTYCIYILYLVL